MEIRYSALRLDGDAQVEADAARDTFWELPPGEESDDAVFDKQMWVQTVMYRWGICGYTAYVSTGDVGSGERAAASVFFAPPSYFPGSLAMPSGPVSGDAILISNVFVDQPYMGLYLEHSLIDTVVTEAERRGIVAVEAFGRNDADTPEGSYFPEGYHGWEERPHSGDLEGAPVLSADILEQQGFEIIGKHPRFPRYRKDLNSAASLFSDFEADTHALLNNSAPLSTVLGGQWA